METTVGVLTAVGLSAACGFRVFLPPLVVGLLHGTGHLELAESFQWLSSPTALIVFGTATGLEILAYFVPMVDNLLDAVATPTAVVAGTLVSASVITDVSPLVQWTTAAILGIGVTAPVQAATASARGALTVSTAGIGNPLFAAGETASSGAMALLGVFTPAIALVLAVAAVIVSFFILRFGLGKLSALRQPPSKMPVRRPTTSPATDRGPGPTDRRS